MEPVTFFFGGWEPMLRIVVVGTLGYIALLLLLRLAGKRTLAQMNAFDFVVTVAIGASFGRILTARSVALAEAVAAFTLLVLRSTPSPGSGSARPPWRECSPLLRRSSSFGASFSGMRCTVSR
ncbi:hypothetical protein BH23GEM7_BH23GEM7_39940 [soil metagenome]